MPNIKPTRENYSEVFSKETKILREGREFLSQNQFESEASHKKYEALLTAYSNLLNQTNKLIKIGDSTQRKLMKVQDELKELNTTKDKFFSIISHDLRNPITSIMVMADFLKFTSNQLTKDDLVEKIDTISDAIKRMFTLFDNLLRWSGAQTGRLEFNPVDFDLSIQLKGIFKLLAVNAMNKNIKLITDLEDQYRIFADKNMIETIIRNLVSNAIKFSPEFSEIMISVIDKPQETKISVIDNGIGISEQNLKKLFRIDSNLRTRGTANETGSGLGLILCKEFVAIHKGTIKATSVVGIGSKFIFTIPKDS